MKFDAKKVELGKQLEETLLLVNRASTALQEAQIRSVQLRAQLELLDDLEREDEVK